MLLSHYNGVCCDLTGLDPHNPRSFAVTRRQWVYFVGSHVCPDCVAESGGAWQLRWKLPWSLLCVRYRRLLVDTCTGCRRRIVRGSTGVKKPVSPSHVPNPFLCRNPRLEGGQSRWEDLCSFPLEKLAKVDLEEWPHHLQTQQTVDGVLDSGKSITGREDNLAPRFLDFRALCILIFTWGVPEDSGAMPAKVRGEFTRYVEARERSKKALVCKTSAREGEERRARHHNVPHNAALMAAVAPTAVSLLTASSAEDPASVIEPFVLRQRKPRTSLYELPKGA